MTFIAVGPKIKLEVNAKFREILRDIKPTIEKYQNVKMKYLDAQNYNEQYLVQNGPQFNDRLTYKGKLYDCIADTDQFKQIRLEFQYVQYYDSSVNIYLFILFLRISKRGLNFLLLTLRIRKLSKLLIIKNK